MTDARYAVHESISFGVEGGFILRRTSCGLLTSSTFRLSVAEDFCEQEQLFLALVALAIECVICLSQISRTRFAGRLREASRTANPLCLHVAPRNTIYCSSPLILRASPLSSKSLGRPSVLLLTFFMSQLWHSFELAQLCSAWIAFVSIGSHKREVDASCLRCGLLWPVSSLGKCKVHKLTDAMCSFCRVAG